MPIEFSERFENEFFEIWVFIASDSIDSADGFTKKIKTKIEDIPSMPYKYRKSTKADDDNIRDLIFNGYVIPYRIKDDVIEILGIFSQNEWEL